MAIGSSSFRHLRRLPFSTAGATTTATATATATATGTATATATTISAVAAKHRLLREFDPDRALAIFSSISDPSSNPASSRFALDLAVRRLARSRRFDDVDALLSSRKSQLPSSESHLATLILSYGTAGMPDHALKLFDEIPHLTSSPPSVTSFNAVLSALVKSKRHRRVPALFADLSEKHSISPDSVSYGVLINAHCLSGKPDRAFEALREMKEKEMKPTTVIYTTLLDSLYKKGKPEEAEGLWKEMVENGCEPDLTAYNVRVMYRALNAEPEGVLELIGEMEADGLKPDTITYNYLITCYCRHGRFVDAMEVYKGLRKKGCAPNAATFKTLLGRLCENGDLEAGLEVFNDSLKHNKVPDFQTVKLFVELLVKGSKIEEAKVVIDGVKKRFPENLVGGWKKVEKQLGLTVEEVSDHVEAA